MNNYEINFDIDYQEWSHYFLLVQKPYLSQSWNYGDAKKESQGWKVTRCIITENNKPIALIQGWYKKFLFISFVRISYGPLWIIKSPSEDQIKSVFYTIKKSFNLKKLKFLSIAPNLENTPENNKILSDLKFYKRNCLGYESGLVDLSQSVTDLRSKLRQSWRRHIKDAEKLGLTFHVSKDHSDIQWMFARFDEFRKKKGFYGHSITLLNSLYFLSRDFQETSVAIVSLNDERLTGVLISYHGLSCTPLITCITEEGRKFNAGNFLTWNCLLYAKTKNCLWFDLGSTTNNNFKARIPHIPFQLIGEYFCFI